MKTSLATTISIAGVVAAGAFTYAVNSSMLTSVSTSAEIAPVDAAVLAPGTTGLTVLAPPLTVVVTGIDAGSGVDAQAVPGDRSAPTSSSSSSSSSSIAPTTTVQVGSSTVSSYSIQGAASVQLVQSASGLSVGSVSPQNGYIYNAESVSATRVVVTLTSSTQKLKFNAELIGGRVVTSLISSEVTAPVAAPTIASAPAAAPSSTTTPRARTQKAEDKHEEHEEHDDD
jgi:ribosomal protein L12E/L44/L45/RPP1/RPP2